jgi:hypothetical protein
VFSDPSGLSLLQRSLWTKAQLSTRLWTRWRCNSVADAPHTFDNRTDAEGWPANERKLIELGDGHRLRVGPG